MNSVRYPRPAAADRPRSGCGRKIAGAALVFLGPAGCCAFTAGQMLAEGPHGSNGEITTSPSAPRTILLIVVSVAVVAGGVFLFQSGDLR